MKSSALIFYVILCCVSVAGFCQPLTFRENGKWGIRDQGLTVIQPAYDTVFNFNASGKVCLACQKTMAASANKFIKTFTKIYLCNYLDRKGIRLAVKTEGNDTNSVFVLGKHSVAQFNDNPSYFVVGVKSKKYLVNNDFRQITFKAYHEIFYSPEPEFIIAQVMTEGNALSSGLINLREETIIPFQYSEIKINTKDSLIIACSAGLRPNSEDDVFNYNGKKIGAYRRHVDMATKNYVIHKLFEPKEYYIIYNISTKEEKNLNAEEIKFYEQDEILIRIKNDWFIYDMVTGEKKPTKQS